MLLLQSSEDQRVWVEGLGDLSWGGACNNGGVFYWASLGSWGRTSLYIGVQKIEPLCAENLPSGTTADASGTTAAGNPAVPGVRQTPAAAVPHEVP